MPVSYTHLIHAGVAFVLQNAENGGCTPNPVTAGNIVGVIAVRRFVLAGSGDASAEQLPRDGGDVPFTFRVRLSM